MSFSHYWPLLLLCGTNIFYHLSAKETNPKINVFASLILTYIVSLIICFAMLYITTDNVDLIAEAHEMNLATVSLGISIVGLEFGSILMYKFGWDISVGSLICNIALAIALVVLGILLYGEILTVKTIAGIVCCLTGLVLINK